MDSLHPTNTSLWMTINGTKLSDCRGVKCVNVYRTGCICYPREILNDYLGQKV